MAQKVTSLSHRMQDCRPKLVAWENTRTLCVIGHCSQKQLAKYWVILASEGPPLSAFYCSMASKQPSSFSSNAPASSFVQRHACTPYFP